MLNKGLTPNLVGIHQLLPSLEEEDAIGNYTHYLQSFFRQKGFDSRIFVFEVKAGQKQDCFPYRRHQRVSSPDNILIFHTAIGSPLAEYFKNCPDKKILIHHNVTPPRFFAGWDSEAAYLAHQARRQLQEMAGSIRVAVADSQFNSRELEALGFPKAEVIPLIFDWNRLAGSADEKVFDQYRDSRTNLLFVGRMVPNKKVEDLIRIFYYYQKLFNPRSRLFLVGEDRQFPVYTRTLFNLAEKLNSRDVIFTGKVNLKELRSYYRLAQGFICMSEHEGLGVPLVESMFYHLPIVAFAATAVPQTLGEAGVLVKEKRLPEIAALINRVVNDSYLRRKILQGQNQRLNYFRSFPYREKWEGIINRLL